MGKKYVSHHNETAVVSVLVLPDQLLTLVPVGMGRFVERRPGHHRGKRMGGPCMSNVKGLSPRAFLASSRTRLAISIRSRQSGSMPGGGGNSAREELSESRCRLSGSVWDSDNLFICLWNSGEPLEYNLYEIQLLRCGHSLGPQMSEIQMCPRRCPYTCLFGRLTAVFNTVIHTLLQVVPPPDLL